MKFNIGEVFRYQNPPSTDNEFEDGYKNFHYYTNKTGVGSIQLAKGINPVKEFKDNNGTSIRPAIFISSSPSKKGTSATPWQDHFDIENGHVRYFGDNKKQGNDPSESPGNKLLLKAFELANSHDPSIRQQTPPIFIFKRVTRNNSPKGYPKFMGVGVVDKVELITQWDNKEKCSFSNYVFDLTVLCLVKDNEQVDIEWINSRRIKNFSITQSNALAPYSWRGWIKHGFDSLNQYRRNVAKLKVIGFSNQLPKKGSEKERILNEVYNYFTNQKVEFEALAEIIAERVINRNMGIYSKGWITRGTGDKGIDFVGKLSIGSDFCKTDLVVLGQAKCEKLNSPTGGNHIARTVAKLRRGWVGVYVTTSYYSEPVQEEVNSDKYPIILINGLRIAEEVQKIVYESSEYDTVIDYLDYISSIYKSRLRSATPEEILL